MTSVPTGSTAALAGAGQATPVFTPDIDGAYVIQLVVNDGSLDSVLSAVTITASSGNVQPVANAGVDQSVVTGNLVTLNGTASTDANTLDVISYTWAFTSVPFGSTATLADSQTVSPTFLPNIDGAYVITLQVNDGSVDSVVDSVTVIASQNNTVPVADAGGDRSVSTGSVVNLNGSGSTDADGDPLTYSWTLVDKPLGSVTELVDSQLKNASFIPDLGGDYIVSLRVFDGKEFSDDVNVTIEVIDSVGDSSGIFSTGFENGLGLWSADNGIWNVGEPTSGPNGAFLDANLAATILDGNYPDRTDSRLVSPSIVLPNLTGFDEIHLRFWQWFSFSGPCQNEFDQGELQVSESLSAGVFSDWVTLSIYKGKSGDWSNALSDLSAYAGKKVRIGFLINNDANGISGSIFCPSTVSSGWYIDEIIVNVVTP